MASVLSFMYYLFSFFDILNINPDDVVQRLDYWGIHCSTSTVSRAFDILAIVVIIVTIYIAWRGGTYKQRRYVRNKVGAENKQFNSRLSRWLFIDTFYLENPLSDFDSPQLVLQQKGHNLIKEFTKNVFKDKDEYNLHLVLGGSGMGKSSFLVGLLRKYVMRNPFNRRYEIELINLNHDNCLERIKRIEEKASTILLLDALDENRDAASAIEPFMANLENEICDFPITVITCRTQFFPNQSSELQTSSISGCGSYKDKLKYRHYYIRYFDDWDVNKYLLKKYPFSPIRYFKAKKAVSLCNSLAHRPLLLSYIDDIIKEKTRHLNTELDLYEKLIELWIRRESNMLSSTSGKSIHVLLNDFSIMLAEKMYRDYSIKSDYYVTGSEADAILEQVGIIGADQSFKTRSLVERDANGNYKFAHRTFMEYFLAQRAFSDDNFPFIIVGLDTVQRFFFQISDRHLREQQTAGFILRGESEAMMNELDQIDIISDRGGLMLKSFQAFQEVRVLSFDYKLLKDVLKYIDGTSVRYLRISGYRRTGSLNSILLHPQVRYLWISGDECSRSFLKMAAKQAVSVIVNDQIALYFEQEDCPMDFLASTKLVTDTNNSMILQFLDYSENYDE